MPNRLADSSSPYLLQHKDNPVDWFPWGEEAFAKAKAEDKPIFLSVGYSSCHWCHVMEHESFEDQEVADELNRNFVNVKVDREERPDVDEAYMTAVQLSAGRGGWPMTVFLTPELNPFFAGTYFPKQDRGGHPGFLTVVKHLGSLWRTGRGEIEQAADEYARALQDALRREAPQTFTELGVGLLHQAVRALASDFDPKHGGFGERPKFPPHTSLEFLMAYALYPEAEQDLVEPALAMSLLTLEKMCLGGIHDQVGGGFHRYSTDERWLLPHFEKMLYDNALMLRNLSWGARFAMELDQGLAQLFIRAAARLEDWLDREMTSPEGLFYSALDADSEGEEGKFYVWSAEEIDGALDNRSAAFKQALGITAEGNFEDEATGQRTGANIPHLQEDRGADFDADLAALAQLRESRPRPGLDHKVIVGWNGLMIGALADAGSIGSAEQAAAAILQAEKEHGRLPRQITNGRPSGDAFLDDYAYFIDALLKLAETDASQEGAEALSDGLDQGSPWLDEAVRLKDEMVDKFYDQARGGFFYTSGQHQMLFGRSKPVFDSPMPSANAAAIHCLLRLGDFQRARHSLESLKGWMERMPQATEALLLCLMDLIELESHMDVSPAQPEEVLPTKSSNARVEVRLAERVMRAPDGVAEARVLIEIPDGYHINTNAPPARWLTPTQVDVQPLKAKIDYPPADGDDYRGIVEIPIKLELPPDSREGEFEAVVKFQACTDTECLLPDERVVSGVVLRD